MTEIERDAVTVVAQLRARPGQERALGEALVALVSPTRREPGCLAYDLHEDADDPASFVLYEIWRSRTEHAANLQTPHLHDFVVRLDDLLDGEIQVSFLRRIA
jgi:quinol monooxygenase YgiN